MKLCLEKRIEGPANVPSDVQMAIHEALGAASMCWVEIPYGIFNAERAEMIGHNLCHLIAHRMEERTDRCPICGDPLGGKK